MIDGDGEGDADMMDGVGSLRDQGAVTQGELLRQEQEASDPPAPVASAESRAGVMAAARAGLAKVDGEVEQDGAVTAGSHGAAASTSSGAGGDESGNGDKHELPHARGPEAIGPEDTGKVESSGHVLDMEAAVGRRGSGSAPAIVEDPATDYRVGASDAMDQDTRVPEQQDKKDHEGDVVLADADGLTEREKNEMENTGTAPEAIDRTGR